MPLPGWADLGTWEFEALRHWDLPDLPHGCLKFLNHSHHYFVRGSFLYEHGIELFRSEVSSWLYWFTHVHTTFIEHPFDFPSVTALVRLRLFTQLLVSMPDSAWGGTGFWRLLGSNLSRISMAEMAQKRKTHAAMSRSEAKRRGSQWITHGFSDAQGSSALLHRVLRPHYRWGQGSFAL